MVSIKGGKERRQQGREGRREKQHKKRKTQISKKGREEMFKVFFNIAQQPAVETEKIIYNDCFTYVSAEYSYILFISSFG